MDAYTHLKQSEDDSEKSAWIYVPNQELISKLKWGKIRVNIQTLQDIVTSYVGDVPLCLTTPIRKSPTPHIHPIVDLDYKKKDVVMDQSERIAAANQIVTILNSANICNLNNWMYSTRPAVNSGIHLYHKYVKVSPEDYYNLLLRIQNVIGSDAWIVDTTIYNMTLPRCGKSPDSDYVYTSPFGDPDPWLWCTDDECKKLSISKPKETGKKNAQLTAKSETLSEYSEKSKEFRQSLVSESLPTTCTEDNALLYTILFPDFEDCNDAYNSATYIHKQLQRTSLTDANDACVVEYLLTNTKCILKLHQNRGINISDIFFTKFIEAYEQGCLENINLLMALQFPVYNRIDDGLYIYTESGWVKESSTYLKFLINAIIDFAKGQTGSKRQISAPFVKLFMETYWAFDEKLTNQKKDIKYMPNHLICTNDFYLYTKNGTSFVKATVLHPYFIGQTCKYTKRQLEEGKVIFDSTFPLILDIFQNMHQVQDGLISFVDLFKRTDFMDCPILACVYFLITYFNFNEQSIKFFLNTMHQILYGLTKCIILMVGESANNGKTTLSKIISEAFGNLCGVFNDAEMVKNTSMTSPDFIRNAQKKITFLDESGDLKLDINVLKRITSNGLSSSRTLFKSTEIVKCLTNFLMCGNTKPIMNIDQGLRKRIRCFELSSEFGYHAEPVELYLSTPHQYSPTNPQFKKFGFNEENMGYGFLLILMYMRPFPVDNVSLFELESSIAFFVKKHVEFDSNFLTTHQELEECISCFCKANSVDSTQLTATFVKKFKSNMNQYGYMGIKINK